MKTKYVICLGDGMADEPIDSLGMKSPLEAARTPNMDFITKNGQSGLVHTVPTGLNPGSDVANMGILGYDPREYYSGRGPIEAASMGLSVGPNQIIFRCNLVHIEAGKMADFTSGHISTEEANILINELNSHFGKDGQEFFCGVSYRHILLLDEKYLNLETTAPHDLTDKEAMSHFPRGKEQDALMAFVEEAHQVLIQSPVNKKRIEKGLAPANYIWPWSQGRMPKLDLFKDRFNLTGGIVTAVDLLKGLAKLTGLLAPNIEGATGFLDTDYAAKVQATLNLLEDHDFTYLHIEAPDEAGHMGDPKLKIQAIEDFDSKIVGEMLKYQKKEQNTVLMVLPDHPTPCRLKTHSSDPVPVSIYKPGIKADDTCHYNEKEAKKGSLKFSYPWELLAYFFHQ
jgi:2,3-bisphosphoglycerate-independent phosphoglycerate mutase